MVVRINRRVPKLQLSETKHGDEEKNARQSSRYFFKVCLLLVIIVILYQGLYTDITVVSTFDYKSIGFNTWYKDNDNTPNKGNIYNHSHSSIIIMKNQTMRDINFNVNNNNELTFEEIRDGIFLDESITSKITVTMITCNRLGLTMDSLATFFKYNPGIEQSQFYMSIDCYNETFVKTIQNKYPTIQLLNSTSQKTIGQLRINDNIQMVYEKVDTEFWVNLEDDWTFIQPNFVKHAIDVLNTVGPDHPIYMVMGRQPNSFKPVVNRTYGWHTTSNNSTQYSVLNQAQWGPTTRFGIWTNNDAVIRISSLRKWGIDDFSKFKDEPDTNNELYKYGALGGILHDGRYIHTGDNHSTRAKLFN